MGPDDFNTPDLEHAGIVRSLKSSCQWRIVNEQGYFLWGFRGINVCSSAIQCIPQQSRSVRALLIKLAYNSEYRVANNEENQAFT